MSRFSFLFLSISTLFLSACFNHGEQQVLDANEVEFHDFEIKYAKGFSVQKTNESLLILIHDPSTGETLDTLNIRGTDSKKVRFYSRIIAQSTTHFAFLQKINKIETLVGLCGMQYLDEQQKSLLTNTQEICNAQGIDIERILALAPDLVFLYPFGDQDKIKLNRFGVQTVYLTEYLENSPLARAEWLKFFALVTGQNPNETGFEEIEEKYLSLVQEPLPSNKSSLSAEAISQWQNEPSSVKIPKPNSVAFNLPFGDVWDMPSGNSISAKLVQDAGLNYFLKDEKQPGNLLFKLEEAYSLVAIRDYWIIIAARPENYSLKDLLAENRVYSTFASTYFKRVIFCNTQTSPYFSEGPIEPHIMLSDLVNCIQGVDLGNKYFKILR